jgi:hypothetical protein
MPPPPVRQPETYEDLPPEAKRVYDTLEKGGELSYQHAQLKLIIAKSGRVDLQGPITDAWHQAARALVNGGVLKVDDVTTMVVAKERVVETIVAEPGRIHLLMGPSDATTPNIAIFTEKRPTKIAMSNRGQAGKRDVVERKAANTTPPTITARDAAIANINAEEARVAELEASLLQIKADLASISPRGLPPSGGARPGCEDEPGLRQLSESVVDLERQMAGLWRDMALTIGSLHGPVPEKAPGKPTNTKDPEESPRNQTKVSADTAGGGRD